jgi:hypothetical protein
MNGTPGTIQNRDSIRWPWPGNGKDRDETDSDRFSRFVGKNRRSFDCAFRDETTKAFAQDDTSFEKVEHFTTGNARAICNSRSLGMRRHGVGFAEVEVEKQISPLRCSQKREQLRSK